MPPHGSNVVTSPAVRTFPRCGDWCCVKFEFRLVLAAVFAATLAPMRARGQDVNGIPNADVRAGYRAISLRGGYLPTDDGRPALYAGQASYQHNFNERFGLQGAALFGKVGGGDPKVMGFQTQFQWQFAESEDAGVDGSLLLVTRIPDGDDGPARMVLVCAGKWIRGDWEARGMIATGAEIGDRARNGALLIDRAELTRRVGTLGRLGAQMSNNWNTTAHFGSFDEQNHQAGIVAKTVIGRHVMVTATTLAGVSRAAPDLESKLFLTLEF